MASTLLFVILLFIFHASPASSGGGSSAKSKSGSSQASPYERQKYVKYETNLLQDLLGNYTFGMRPVMSSNDPAVVQFDLRLKKLVKLDIREQVLQLEAFILMRWMDPQVRWKKESYNGTDIVNIPSSSIWTPDIELYNNAKDQSSTAQFRAPVIASPNGSLVWTNPVTLYGSCDIDITWFPLDVQECPLTFGSWSYSHKRLEIKLYRKPAEYSDMKAGKMFVANGVWIFLKTSTSLSLQTYSCCSEPFSQIEYSFKLKRRPNFFLLYLILPCVAIIILSLLTFVIPPEAGERIGFGVTVILSFSVYLIVIADKLPEKSDASPLLGVLYVLVFYILVFSFVISTINARMFFNTHRPPKWLLNLAQGSKGKWSLSFGRVRKTKVEAFNSREIKGTKDWDSDPKELNDEIDKPCEEKIGNELYKDQWRIISGYLDMVFLKIVLVLVCITPWIVVKLLENNSDNQ